MVIMQFCLITNLCKQSLMVDMFTRGYWRLQGGFLMLSVSFCGGWLRGAKIILLLFLGHSPEACRGCDFFGVCGSESGQVEAH
ncbi:hypothetical protein CUMW_242150 [Citrus unshiu]|uniref:Uncharacterized protein n=1 Tax=Citrus unshiu TaxID=55188 RepID=A0A2H5QMT7_CITUN|nr:hypothetical protein CUMW_242150 [Citrus unshiu]